MFVPFISGLGSGGVVPEAAVAELQGRNCPPESIDEEGTGEAEHVAEDEVDPDEKKKKKKKKKKGPEEEKKAKGPGKAALSKIKKMQAALEEEKKRREEEALMAQRAEEEREHARLEKVTVKCIS